jgi:preprotein translocase subunit SecA
MRVDELEFLNQPLTELKQGELRQMARELDVSLNPTHESNLARLVRILDLEPDLASDIIERLQGGIRHSVLNAKKHDEESAIIAGAGGLGGVTIATNMAGRGVDIKLGGELAEEVLAAVNRVLRRLGVENPEVLSLDERQEALKDADREAIGIYQAEVDMFRQHLAEERQVREVGGLHVIGSERHESRRIDNQLRGRAARQGDPGSSQFFLSLQDELMRLFAGQQVSNLMQRLRIDDAIPLAHNLVNRTIEQAQTRVEGAHFDTRKHLLEYDDVLNQQREVFYSQRNRVFAKDDLGQDIDSMLLSEVDRHVEMASMDPDGKWKLLAWMEETQPTLNLDSDRPYPSYMLRLILDDLADAQEPGAVKQALLDIARRSLDAQGQHFRRSVDESLERAIERLDDQVQSRVEMADMAIEGAIIEAEEFNQPVDPQSLMGIIEQAAGLRIQMDPESMARLREEPRQFRRQIPDLIEGSMGLRIWAGLVQTIERRLGQSLELTQKMQIPIDWDEAEKTLKEAFEQKWSDRAETLLADIQRELENNLGSQVLNEKEKLRQLVHMSFGQVSFFDKKTHQRRSVRVARLTFTYAAADLVTKEAEELTSDLMDHLDGARDAVQFALGWSELMRVASQSLGDVDEGLQSTFNRALGDENYETYAAKGQISEWSEAEQREVAQLVGSVILSRVYRDLILSVGDRAWVDYLTSMEALRTSIGLEAYGQRDPLVQYKSRAFDMFSQLLIDIRAGVVSRMYRFRSSIQPQGVPSSTGAAAAAPGAKPRSGKSKRRRRRR